MTVEAADSAAALVLFCGSPAGCRQLVVLCTDSKFLPLRFVPGACQQAHQPAAVREFFCACMRALPAGCVQCMMLCTELWTNCDGVWQS
jgi:hypothetical protein